MTGAGEETRGQHAELERLQHHVINGIRAIHQIAYGEGCEYDTCTACDQPYPCPTLRLLDGADTGHGDQQ